MESSEVLSSIYKMDRLSTIPVILGKIHRIAGNIASPPEALYEVISRDQALADRVISVANSSFFGHRDRIGGIRQAILLLGYDQIRNIALGLGVASMIPGGCSGNLKNFWAHSYEVAFISAMIAETATMLNPASAFLCGLLHDTGRLVFYHLDTAGYKNISGSSGFIDAEISLFGCDHALVSSWVAEKARLPEEQIVAIKHHHSPDRAAHFRDFVSVISLAEALSTRFSPRDEGDGFWTWQQDEIRVELSIGEKEMEEMRQRFGEMKPEIRRFLELT